MKFEDCKIGQTVKANECSRGVYVYTGIECNYKGKIIGINKKDKMIAVEYVGGEYVRTADKYGYWVSPKHFDLLGYFGNLEEIYSFKCYRADTKIIVTYKGKKLATAKCNPSDKFDEEFGLALALGRALRNKEFKTKKEIVITESIFDYIK